MKITYEFICEPDSEGYLDFRIFQKANEMYAALNELDEYVRLLNKEYISDDKETIIERLFDIIYKSQIGDIE